EAYLPILEALGRLCREPIGVRLIEVLNRYAPTWRAQMPSVLDSSENDVLRRKILGATPQRMLREMAEALEALSADAPLILVLEDAHWIDYSTLVLISAIARRREAARLFVIITCRPVELVLTDHPLRKVIQELQHHSLSNEIALPFLKLEEVCKYLSLRFPNSSVASTLSDLIHDRTEGNPLFMVDVVDY